MANTWAIISSSSSLSSKVRSMLLADVVVLLFVFVGVFGVEVPAKYKRYKVMQKILSIKNKDSVNYVLIVNVKLSLQ